MYIVYDKDNNINSLRSKYLVLELDTLEFSDGEMVRTYAIVDSEHITFQELPELNNLKALHESVLINYRHKNWDKSIEQMEELRGSFRGELDTFYDELTKRINTLRATELAEDWSGNLMASK